MLARNRTHNTQTCLCRRVKKANDHQGREEYDCRNCGRPTQKIRGTSGAKKTTRRTTTESSTHICALAMLHQDKNYNSQRRSQHCDEC